MRYPGSSDAKARKFISIAERYDIKAATTKYRGCVLPGNGG